jgi:hypothetical protein
MKSSASRIDIAGWWYDLDQRAKLGLAAGLGLIVIILCITAVLLALNLFPSGDSEVKETPTSPASILATAPMPTWTPLPTEALEPTEEPTLEPTPVFQIDSENDVMMYETQDPVDQVPEGVDIQVANVAGDLSVVLASPPDVPEALAGWATEDEVLLWLELYKPIPEAPTDKLEWIFVLDMDGNTATGRPVGQRPINPDLGYEVAVALTYDADNGAYSAYCLVWASGSWVAGPQVRYYKSESGTVIGLALSRDALVTSVTENSAVTTAPDSVKGRVAALFGMGASRVADFYPELP